jgi:Transposase IS116/IS110/IS902 family
MSRFPTAAHLAAWAGLAPAMNESAGKQTPAGKRHGNKWLAAMLVEAAGSVGRIHGKNYLAAQHARSMKRRGMGRAQVAVARTILVSAYWMLKRDEPYHDLGVDWHTPPQRPSPHPTSSRVARTPRPHGDHRPSRLNTGPHAASSPRPTLPRPALWSGIHGSVMDGSGPRPSVTATVASGTMLVGIRADCDTARVWQIVSDPQPTRLLVRRPRRPVG